jgi:hypothetical protein
VRECVLTIARRLLGRDPSGSMIAFGDMMRKQIVMPAHLMDDREHQGKHGRNLFKDFSSVAQATGTYTGHVRAPRRPFMKIAGLGMLASCCLGICQWARSCACTCCCLLVVMWCLAHLSAMRQHFGLPYHGMPCGSRIAVLLGLSALRRWRPTASVVDACGSLAGPLLRPGVQQDYVDIMESSCCGTGTLRGTLANPKQILGWRRTTWTSWSSCCGTGTSRA